MYSVVVTVVLMIVIFVRCSSGPAESSATVHRPPPTPVVPPPVRGEVENWTSVVEVGPHLPSLVHTSGAGSVDPPAPIPTPGVEKGSLLDGPDKRTESRAISEELLYRRIRLPIFRGQLDEARIAFRPIAKPSVATGFFELIEQLRKTHKELKLKYEGNETIYRNWAEVEFLFEITGRPKSYRDRRRPEETLVKQFTATVHFLKQERQWQLVDWPTHQFLENLIQQD